MDDEGENEAPSELVEPGQRQRQIAARFVDVLRRKPLPPPTIPENAPSSDEILRQLDSTRTSMNAQSPFMARQAERPHLTGLSPIEEMRLAQNELRAKAASQLVRIQTPIRSCSSRRFHRSML
ncbi:hypothetical protein PINS_up022521 [Pythium insidiosum]|nr:hypothetical protein PINS_up022521 [Pythium insidiosum]